MVMKNIKTRFCPSPTGLMHIGNARTAIFNALFAYKHNGVFLLRIEDTDTERSQNQYIDALCDDLRWLGLEWQAGYDRQNGESYRQSERADIYQHYLQKLTENQRIYPCFCSAETLAVSRRIQLKMGKPPRYDGTCRDLKPVDLSQKHTLRFKVISGKTSFIDFVKGSQRYDNETVGDFIIKRSQGAEGFFFTNAIDDALMGVTHVLRGEDHLSNTPRQMMILQTLGLDIPQYGHIALTLGEDGKPLSKRNGSLSIAELRELGYMPLALVNYLARLGHTYEHSHLMTLPELAEYFDVARISKAPAKFDVTQLNHWQQLALEQCDHQTLWQWMKDRVVSLVPSDKTQAFVQAVRPNVLLLADALMWAQQLFTEITIDMLEPQQKILQQTPSVFFDALLSGLRAQLDYATLVNHIKAETNLTGKALFQPLRIVLTGCSTGPEMAKILPLMDKELLTKRVKLFTG